MEKVRPWCGQPSDRGRLTIRSDSSRQLESLASSKNTVLFGYRAAAVVARAAFDLSAVWCFAALATDAVVKTCTS